MDKVIPLFWEKITNKKDFGHKKDHFLTKTMGF